MHLKNKAFGQAASLEGFSSLSAPIKEALWRQQVLLLASGSSRRSISKFSRDEPGAREQVPIGIFSNIFAETMRSESILLRKIVTGHEVVVWVFLGGRGGGSKRKVPLVKRGIN